MTQRVPLFPLDGVVLLPGSTHAFHIFEWRYRMLVSDVLQGDKMLAVPLLKPGWEPNYFDSPEVHRVIGVGEIVEWETLPDGRHDIRVEGRHRARTIRETQERPFRIAEVEVLEDHVAPEARASLPSEMQALGRLALKLIELVPQFHFDLAALSFDTDHASRTIDLAAHMLVRDTYARQSILNEPEISRRLQLTRVQVLMLLQRFMAENEFTAFVEAQSLH
jgi:Lon protease-like protein